MLDELKKSVFRKQEEYCRVSREIWEHPELGYQEKHACGLQLELLKNNGFETVNPYLGLETAYLGFTGTDGPVFCFVAEYDALPELGHGCGHNLICTAAIAAATACAELLKKHRLPGKVLVMGTPAEESGGGKVKLLEKGCLDGVDAAMMVHPSWRTVPDAGSTAIRRFTVEFTGKSAHAAAAPELALNALDAAVMLYNGISAWRQQLPENARVHGIISEGGKAPNIIPARSSSRYFLRCTSDAVLDKMEARFFDIVKGAALMTGTGYEIKPLGIPYRSRLPNPEMNRIFIDAANDLGMNPQSAKPGRGSSDFGDFSQEIPGIHPYFGISDCGEIAAHSIAFAEAAKSDYGMEQMLKSAVAMAQVGYLFLTDAEIRAQVKKSGYTAS